MADFGSYNGQIKANFDLLTQLTANGSNTSVTIDGAPNAAANESSRWITCIITTTGNTLIELNAAATANSFPLTASDTLIAAIPSGGIIGTWGDGGTPTVTIKRVIT